MSVTTPTTSSIFETRESAVRSYCRAFPTTFVKAVGSTMTDADGNEYIDFLAGCSSLNYGHNHPAMKEALIEHINSDGVTHGLDMHTDAKAEFLETFEKLILKPRGLNHRVMFTGPTGANAVEAALKLARKVTGRTGIISFTNGFHGMTLGALAVTGNQGKRDGAGVALSDVSHAPYDEYFGENVDTADQLDISLSDSSSGLDAPAAIVVETVQGEGGLNAASAEWLQKIEKIARKHGALFIVDDIQAGCGRTGAFFSFEDAGLKPDIITMAKSLSGMGLPFALTLIREDLDIWKPGEHNGTFRGNNHAFVTARKAFELFWSDDTLEKEVRAKSDYMKSRLSEIVASSRITKRVKGRGMMRGIEMTSGELASDICADCFDNGLIIETSGAQGEVVKILCALNIPQAQLEKGIDILSRAVAKIEANQSSRAAA